MIPFHRILFPIDFSQASEAMVPYVAQMAQRFNASVTVLNAFHLIQDFSMAAHLDDSWDSARAEIPYTDEMKALREERQKHLRDFLVSYLPGVAYSAKIEDGEPANVIKSVAEHERTDLIMMPTKGLGTFRRLLLGSVTAKVLHDVPCPIFTSAHVTESGFAALAGFRSIVCAVELNPDASEILKTAAFLAEAYSARLCLLHVGSSREHDEEASAQLLRQAFAGIGNTAVNPTVRVLDARVAEGVRTAAVEEKADLVVVGRGRQKGSLSLMWSHLYGIVAESPCPILSV